MSAKLEKNANLVMSSVTTVTIKPGMRKKHPRQQQNYQPKTALGRKLWNLRQQILSSGEPLLDWDDLDSEIAERKGEQQKGTHETDVH